MPLEFVKCKDLNEEQEKEILKLTQQMEEGRKSRNFEEAMSGKGRKTLY